MVSALASPAVSLLQLSSLQALSSKHSTCPFSCSPAGAVPLRSTPSRIVAAASTSGSQGCLDGASYSRRDATLSGIAAFLALASPVLAEEMDDEYKRDTQAVIDQVKGTLSLDKNDPTKADAVQSLKKASNAWVAKYRREKQVAGKPSFSNMYSVLNAVSGHYISFGPTYPIPVKRKDRILEEVQIAEKALGRGR
eukprot:TRINITY_DN14777_c0_g1_i1.p1 TRINITY_DN14777_c0_g1~~TRINITY_DN14777_c0_g1_i1.p1  ORF type:complete len:195 (+),score=40.32 TRINITY_DN14777_c0_g1_i1:90-674(+)